MAPFLTRIEDTLYTPNGELVNGTIYIATTSTFVSLDGYTILLGFTVVVPVENGVLNVGLVPTQWGSPPTTYATYYVKVAATEQYFDMVWTVPQSASPITLADVN